MKKIMLTALALLAPIIVIAQPIRPNSATTNREPQVIDWITSIVSGPTNGITAAVATNIIIGMNAITNNDTRDVSLPGGLHINAGQSYITGDNDAVFTGELSGGSVTALNGPFTGSGSGLTGIPASGIAQTVTTNNSVLASGGFAVGDGARGVSTTFNGSGLTNLAAIPIWNIDHYGALGNDIAADSVALTLASSNAFRFGGTVFFPRKPTGQSYIFTNQLVVPSYATNATAVRGNNIAFAGESRGGSRIRLALTNGVFLTCLTTPPDLRNFSVTDVGSGTNAVVYNLNSSFNFNFTSIGAYDFSNSIPFVLTAGAGAHITDMVFTNCFFGVRLNRYMDGVTLDGFGNSMQGGVFLIGGSNTNLAGGDRPFGVNVHVTGAIMPFAVVIGSGDGIEVSGYLESVSRAAVACGYPGDLFPTETSSTIGTVTLRNLAGSGGTPVTGVEIFTPTTKVDFENCKIQTLASSTNVYARSTTYSDRGSYATTKRYVFDQSNNDIPTAANTDATVSRTNEWWTYGNGGTNLSVKISGDGIKLPNKTVSRIAMIGGDGYVTNAGASSATTPINRDGSASTSAQIGGLFTGGSTYLKADGTTGDPVGSGSGTVSNNAALSSGFLVGGAGNGLITNVAVGTGLDLTDGVLTGNATASLPFDVGLAASDDIILRSALENTQLMWVDTATNWHVRALSEIPNHREAYFASDNDNVFTVDGGLNIINGSLYSAGVAIVPGVALTNNETRNVVLAGDLRVDGTAGGNGSGFTNLVTSRIVAGSNITISTNDPNTASETITIASAGGGSGPLSTWTRFVFVGNSRMSSGDGTAATQPSWDNYFTNGPAAQWMAFSTNAGVNARTTASMLSGYAGEIYPHRPSGGTNAILFGPMDGIVDIAAGTSAATTWGNISNIWWSAKTNDWKIVAFTTYPTTALTAARRQELQLLNRYIRTNSMPDVVVDLADKISSVQDTTDGTHQNDMANIKIASLVWDALSRPTNFSTTLSDFKMTGVQEIVNGFSAVTFRNLQAAQHIVAAVPGTVYDIPGGGGAWAGMFSGYYRLWVNSGSGNINSAAGGYLFNETNAVFEFPLLVKYVQPTNGTIYIQQSVIPTNAIKASSASVTNWTSVNINGVLRTLATNYAAAGSFMEQTPAVGGGWTQTGFTP